jgi:hypothetical protein
MASNPYEDMTTERDASEDFLRALRREPSETTSAMFDGINFENLVTDSIEEPRLDHKWGAAAATIADIVRGGQLQFKASRPVEIAGLQILLYGRLDALKAGTIYDIKFSRSYDRGKFFDSTQHPMYFELIPEATRFEYLVSDGFSVWTEAYDREDTPSIIPVAADFLEYLVAVDLIGIFKDHWGAR